MIKEELNNGIYISRIGDKVFKLNCHNDSMIELKDDNILDRLEAFTGKEIQKINIVNRIIEDEIFILLNEDSIGDKFFRKGYHDIIHQFGSGISDTTEFTKFFTFDKSEIPDKYINNFIFIQYKNLSEKELEECNTFRNQVLGILANCKQRISLPSGEDAIYTFSNYESISNDYNNSKIQLRNYEKTDHCYLFEFDYYLELDGYLFRYFTSEVLNKYQELLKSKEIKVSQYSNPNYKSYIPYLADIFSNVVIKNNYVVSSRVDRENTIVTNTEIEAFITLYNNVLVYDTKENKIKLYNYDKISKSRIEEMYNENIERNKGEKYFSPELNPEITFIYTENK